MSSLLFQVLFLISFVLYVPQITGQPGTSNFDSVALIKQKVSKDLYKFLNNGDKEIQFSNKKPELVANHPNTKLINAENGLMTSLTGIRFNTANDGKWRITATISCNDTLPDWSLQLFCEGYQTRERERVRNEDGSWSLETKENNVYNWDKNSTGILMEGNDTIGFFVIIMNPREDTLLKPWSSDIYLREELPQNFKSKTKWSIRLPEPSVDFATYGIFREKSFIIIRNGRDRKAWIIMDNVLSSSFHSDLNNPAINKTNSLLSYLLINKNDQFQDKRDLFRLAMMSHSINNSLSLH